MDSVEVIKLYKKGYSIEYIVNRFYNVKKRNNKLIDLENRRIIIIDNIIKKSDVRLEVAQIIYLEHQKNKKKR